MSELFNINLNSLLKHIVVYNKHLLQQESFFDVTANPLFII